MEIEVFADGIGNMGGSRSVGDFGRGVLLPGRVPTSGVILIIFLRLSPWVGVCVFFFCLMLCIGGMFGNVWRVNIVISRALRGVNIVGRAIRAVVNIVIGALVDIVDGTFWDIGGAIVLTMRSVGIVVGSITVRAGCGWSVDRLAAVTGGGNSGEKGNGEHYVCR